ncbi:hypothetical protein BGW80DRAFT_1546324 [Lactifluus volemus]|nr:hypothetical protein BGW80DRAFT_1546324 [Lactifluus volemus]
MAPNTYSWISAWFVLTTPVIIWDAFYCLMRPRSMVGGDLHWIWAPYALYQEVDYVPFMNLIETALNLCYLYLAHVVKYPAASVVGFASVTMTLSKTMLYWIQEYYCNYSNAVARLWLVVPTLVIIQLGKDITSSIYVAARESEKRASGKEQ